MKPVAFIDLSGLVHSPATSWETLAMSRLLDNWPTHLTDAALGFDSMSQIEVFSLESCRQSRPGQTLGPPKTRGWGLVPETHLPWAFGCYVAVVPTARPAALDRLERLIHRAADRTVMICCGIGETDRISAVDDGRSQRLAQQAHTVASITRTPLGWPNEVHIGPGADDLGSARAPYPAGPLRILAVPPTGPLASRFVTDVLDATAALEQPVEVVVVLGDSAPPVEATLRPGDWCVRLNEAAALPDLVDLAVGMHAVAHGDPSLEAPVRAEALLSLGVPVAMVRSARGRSCSGSVTFDGGGESLGNAIAEVLSQSGNRRLRAQLASEPLSSWASAATELGHVVRGVAMHETS